MIKKTVSIFLLLIGVGACCLFGKAIERVDVVFSNAPTAEMRQSLDTFLNRLKGRVSALSTNVSENDVPPTAGTLLIRILPFFAVENSPGPEGYRLRVFPSPAGGVVAEVTGADRLGMLYGLGAIYRKSALEKKGFSIPLCDETSAPRYAVRSVNQGWSVNMDSGMRKATNARQWKREEAMAYQEELIVLGQNAYTHGWGGGSPVNLEKYTGEKKQVNTFVMDFCERYGLKYILSTSVNAIGRDNMKPEWRAELYRYRSEVHACPSVPESRETMIRIREIAALHSPRVDYVLLLPGDVAGCDCPKCAPWALTYYDLAVDMAKAIHKHKPQAKVLVSNQEFQIEANRLFFDRLYKEKSPELAGYVYGPGSSENSFYGYVKPNRAYEMFPGVYPASTFLKSRLNYLAPGQEVLGMIDIGHWKRSQTSPTLLDAAYLEIFERRSFNATPERLGRVWREILPYIELGIGYSESIFDDFGKFFSLRILWSPQLSNREITREYAALYYGENVADLLTQAIYLHESNAEAPLLNNGANILKCHEMVEQAWSQMSEPYRQNNWRFDLLRQRVAFDAWLWVRMDAQQKAYDAAMRQLRLMQAVPDKAALEAMIAALDASGRIEALDTYRAIMQATDTALDKAAGLKSIALHRIDSRPDNVGVGWLINQLEKMSAAATPEAAQAIKLATTHYDVVGEGEYYDNCGVPGQMPHFDPTSAESYYGSGHLVKTSRPSQRSYVYGVEAVEGPRFVYPQVDPQAAYRVDVLYPNPDGVTFALNSPNEFEVYANGTLIGQAKPTGMHHISPTSQVAGQERRLLTAPRPKDEYFTLFSFDIPQELTASGALEIQLKKVHGKSVSTAVSEIWIRKR